MKRPANDKRQSAASAPMTLTDLWMSQPRALRFIAAEWLWIVGVASICLALVVGAEDRNPAAPAHFSGTSNGSIP